MGSRRSKPAAGPPEIYPSPSPHGGRGRQSAFRVGDAPPHRQSPRSEWFSIDVPRGIVHRRTGGGGQNRSAGIPHEDADSRHDRPAFAARAPSRFSKPLPKLTGGIGVLRPNNPAPNDKRSGAWMKMRVNAGHEFVIGSSTLERLHVRRTGFGYHGRDNRYTPRAPGGRQGGCLSTSCSRNHCDCGPLSPH